jgi:hypothetical protein
VAGEAILSAELAIIANACEAEAYSVYVDEELYGNWVDCSKYH